MFLHRVRKLFKNCANKTVLLGLFSLYVVLALLKSHDLQYHSFEFKAVDQTAEMLRRFDPNSPKRDVIAYVTMEWRAESLARSITKLFENFNRKYRYPVIIFYEKPANLSTFLHYLVIEKGLEMDDYKLLEFIPIKFKLPDEYQQRHHHYDDGYEAEALKNNNRSTTTFIPVFRHIFPGYHHVLNFWFQRVFDEPIMQSVGFVWRLDADSYVLSPVNYDPFKFMRKNGYLYGYRAQLADALFVTVGLWDFVEDFLQKYRIQPVEGQLPAFPPGRNSFERRNFAVPMYYNNFEVLHVPTFQQHTGIRAFAREVRDSLQIYEQRWGDAPLRYLTISMFLDRDKYVHHFCDINYFHQGNFTPSCPPPE